MAGGVLVDLLERADELTEVVPGELDVLRDSAGGLQVGQRLLEAVAVHALHDLAVHLDEAPVRVVREARVARRLGETFDRDVREPEVEDAVHHPRHRDRGAAPDGDEERLVGVPEALAGALLERCHVPRDLVVEALWHVSTHRHVRAAGVGRDREARRDGDPELRHLGEPDSLAAEELPPAARVLVEVVHVAHLRGESTRPRRYAEPAWLCGRPRRRCRQMRCRWCTGGASS